MPPKIARVKWSAKNIPYGMEFSEVTGTFFGKPEVAGEYTVPVTVETNYGKDTKDVKITVRNPTPALPTYGVYARGNEAASWSGGTEPDSDGFYKIPIPDMEKLSNWTNGFCAYTHGGDVYQKSGVIPLALAMGI